MDRRAFGMTLLGGEVIWLKLKASPLPSRIGMSNRPQPGSVKAKMHSGPAGSCIQATEDRYTNRARGNHQERGWGRPLPSGWPTQPFADRNGVGQVLQDCRGAWCRRANTSPAPEFRDFDPGRYADLGVLSMYVPQIEEVETVTDALNNFYFPPLGNRSWGGNLMVAQFGVGGGQPPPSYTDQLEYARWWNSHACLGLQIQSLRGALNVRNLVRPGIDWVTFGPGDMALDVARHSNSPIKNIDEAHR